MSKKDKGEKFFPDLRGNEFPSVRVSNKFFVDIFREVEFEIREIDYDGVVIVAWKTTGGEELSGIEQMKVRQRFTFKFHFVETVDVPKVETRVVVNKTDVEYSNVD